MWGNWNRRTIYFLSHCPISISYFWWRFSFGKLTLSCLSVRIKWSEIALFVQWWGWLCFESFVGSSDSEMIGRFLFGERREGSVGEFDWINMFLSSAISLERLATCSANFVFESINWAFWFLIFSKSFFYFFKTLVKFSYFHFEKFILILNLLYLNIGNCPCVYMTSGLYDVWHATLDTFFCFIQ